MLYLRQQTKKEIESRSLTSLHYKGIKNKLYNLTKKYEKN